jgi:hypothetical protein
VANMRIKVNIIDLIDKIEEAKANALLEYQTKSLAFEADTVLWDLRVKKAIAAIKPADVQDVWQDHHNGSYRWVIEIDLKDDKDDLSMPYKPSKPNLEQYAKDTALLLMASDSTIAISTEDRWAKYL